MDHRIEDHGDVVYIAMEVDGVWARSEFPHPLLTIDYDADDKVIGVSPAGSRIDPTLEAYRAWRLRSRDAHELVAQLRGNQ